jgi:hypothetical protein
MATLAWSMTLGSYDDDAIKTLPHQLEMLRLLADVRSPDVTLTFHLTTVRIDDDLNCFFQLSCYIDGSEFSVEQAQNWRDLAAVSLIRAYSLGHKPPEPVTHAHMIYLAPDVATAADIPTKHDWSHLVDHLRRREQPVTIALTCRYAGAAAVPYRRRRVAVNEVIGFDDEATDFFVAANNYPTAQDAPQLRLEVTVSSEAEIDSVFATLVGRAIFGTPVRATEDSAAVRHLVGVPEDLVRVWHAPYGHIEGRGALGRRTTHRAIHSTVPDLRGSSLGTATAQGRRFDKDVEIRLSNSDRTKHVYIIGKTGSGKTNFLGHLASQDMASGAGCAVITPHQGLNEYLIANAGDRVDDIVFLDFGDPDFLPAMNPLTMDVENSLDYQLASEEMLRLIVSHTFNQYTGPIFEDTMRMVLESVRVYAEGEDSPPTMSLALEFLQSAVSRDRIMKYLKERDPELSERWDMFTGMSGTQVAEHTRHVAAKLSPFGPAGSLHAITSSSLPNGFSLKQFYEEDKILLVTLPETKFDSQAVEYLGSMIFGRLYSAARNSGRTRDRPFFLFVDEFQRFVSNEVEELVAEARKFNVSLTFAHQNLRQLSAFSKHEGGANSRLKDAIFSNVGTLVAMKLSGSDVDDFATEFQLPQRAVREIGQFEAMVRPVIDGREWEAFTLRVPKNSAVLDGDAAMARVRANMISTGVWQPRDVLTESSLGVVREPREKEAAERRKKMEQLKAAQKERLDAMNQAHPTSVSDSKIDVTGKSALSFLDDQFEDTTRANPSAITPPTAPVTE